MDRKKLISIVTPSYNHGEFIEETIKSVISQEGDFYLEYFIMDGGSTDNSVEIIKKYDGLLKKGQWPVNCQGITFDWVSEADDGQSDALNKGFAKSTGEVMAYLNSDDKYMPLAFKTVTSIFAECSDVEWLSSLWQAHWNCRGELTPGDSVRGFTKDAFYKGRTLAKSKNFTGWIQQESTFWRKSLWEKSGAFITKDFNYAMDFDLWARFFEHAELYGVTIPLGGFRIQKNQKTAGNLQVYYDEAQTVLARYGEAKLGKRRPIYSDIVRGLFLPEYKMLQGIKARFIKYDYAKERWYTRSRII